MSELIAIRFTEEKTEITSFKVKSIDLFFPASICCTLVQMAESVEVRR